MDIPNMFRHFFGFRRYSNDDHFNHSDADDNNFNEDRFMDSTFSEIHTFFEKHINDIFGNFTIPNPDTLFEITPESEYPFVNSSKQELNPDARYNLLKPGYESTSKENNEKIDTDLDDRLENGKLNEFMYQNDNKSPVKNSRNFYSKSIITRTVISNGTCITEKTVTDQDGNVEKTVTHQESKTNTNDFECQDKPNQLFPFKFF